MITTSHNSTPLFRFVVDLMDNESYNKPKAYIKILARNDSRCCGSVAGFDCVYCLCQYNLLWICRKLLTSMVYNKSTTNQSKWNLGQLKRNPLLPADCVSVINQMLGGWASGQLLNQWRPNNPCPWLRLSQTWPTGGFSTVSTPPLGDVKP